MVEKKEENGEHAIVYHAPSMSEIASEIISECPSLLKAGNISWGKFEDGFPNLFIEDIEEMRGRNVVFLASFLNHDEFLSQMSVILSLPRYLSKALFIVLPYFPTGTMERINEEGQIATAMTLARLLSATPLNIGGPSRLIVYDIHALQNRFYFSDSIIPMLATAIPLFLDVLKSNHSSDDITIAFPDDGACKRFGNMFTGMPLVICNKVREKEKRIVRIKEGEEFVKGKHVFIVDDLVKTGGTLIDCKDVLMKCGATEVSAFVTHAVFPQESWKRFSHEHSPSGSQFSIFYTTDSCPEVSSVLKEVKPFHILHLSSSICEMLFKF